MAMAAATGNVASVIAGDETVTAAPATTNVVKQQTMCPVMGGVIAKRTALAWELKELLRAF